jgi:hypothetical protein
MYPSHYFPHTSLACRGGPPVHEIPRRGLARAIGAFSSEGVIEPSRTATRLAVLACGAALFLSQDARLVVLEDSEQPPLVQAQPIPGTPAEAWATLERIHGAVLGRDVPRFWPSREHRRGAVLWGAYDLAVLRVLARSRCEADVRQWLGELQADPAALALRQRHAERSGGIAGAA